MTAKEEGSKTQGRGVKFARYVIDRVKSDMAFGARLRRADNPATEFQAWEYLIRWCDIEKPWERLPFILIAAALARAKRNSDGNLGLGRSIAGCYDEGRDSEPAKARLRRLLACDSVEEACRVLRPILSLIQSKGKPLCYGGLLDELLWFSNFGERQKTRWATEGS